jgi:hypothetical protein
MRLWWTLGPVVRARQEIQPFREAEGGPLRPGLDTRLQVGTGMDLHPAAGGRHGRLGRVGRGEQAGDQDEDRAQERYASFRQRCRRRPYHSRLVIGVG